MITSLIIGQDKAVSEWVAEKLGVESFEPCTAIGIMLDGRLIAGVVYHNYLVERGIPRMIEFSIASIDKRWCTRHNIITLASYPFIQLNVKRLQATCSADDHRMRAILLRLGFQLEGIGRAAHLNGDDSAVFSILKHECRWINGQTINAKSTRPSTVSNSAGNARSR